MENTKGRLGVLLRCCMCIGGAMGMVSNCIGIYFTPLAKALDVGVGRISIMVTLISLGNALFAPMFAAGLVMMVKAPELLKEIGVSDEMVHAVVCHAWGMCSDVQPEHMMEKVLFATDELTGLIGAVAIMRPSKSVVDLELKSVKKKFKDKKFAAGCSREVIAQGAEMMGVELDELIDKTIEAMRSLMGEMEI